jgi:hypothetical protein
LFCILDTEHLKDFIKEDFEIGNTPSNTGDECHRDLLGIKNKQAEKYKESICKPPNIYMCFDNIHKSITWEEYEDLGKYLSAKQ